MSRTRLTPARRLNPEVPDRLDICLSKMLAKEPKQRYQNYSDLIRDLEKVIAMEHQHSEPSPSGGKGH